MGHQTRLLENMDLLALYKFDRALTTAAGYWSANHKGRKLSGLDPLFNALEAERAAGNLPPRPFADLSNDQIRQLEEAVKEKGTGEQNAVEEAIRYGSVLLSLAEERPRTLVPQLCSDY